MKSLFLGIALAMTLSAAHAQSTTSGDDQAETTVKYLGTQDDMLVFNVFFPNPEGSKFQLTIKDQDGSPLYQGSFNDTAFFKQFLLPKTENDRLVFVFHTGHETDVIKTFEINVNSRVVRDVAIKKLD